MDSGKFLILGANGQLGKALQAKYPDAIAVDSSELDITNQQSLENYDWSSITHILNAAAYTKVDHAETPDGRKAAWQVNAHAIARLAKIANDYGITLIHISSEYVFDGIVENHMEDESFAPLSAYGASKAAGDIAATSAQSHYILRTSWVIGDGTNFVRTMINLANKNISPTVVSDQYGRLTFTSELVRAIDHLLTTGAAFGTYNVSNAGQSISWADITRQIFAELGRSDLTVTDTTTAEYFAGKDNVAQRPLQSTLNLDKIHATGFEPIGWEELLTAYLKEQTR